MRTQLLRGFYVDELLVEPLKGQVSNQYSVETISPAALDVLLHLASQPGEVIGRRYLLDEVWGRDHGSHDSLGQAINELRIAVGDETNFPTIIESVSDRGYRLNGKVRLQYFPDDNGELADIQPELLAPRDDRNGLAILWAELQKRRVVRVGIGYLVSAWVVLQIADVISGVLDLPNWSLKLLTVILGLGFIVTIIVSWLLQVTPQGIRFDRTTDKTLRTEARHYIELSIIIVLLAVVGVLSYRQIWTPQPPRPSVTQIPPSATPLPVFDSSIAVLPFVNMGGDPGDSYFGDGLAEELLHKLVRIKSLKVAARTSSFHIGKQGADIPTIASRLQVANVLEGSIRREGERMRITAQLVDANGFHLWSDAFDVKFAGVLDVQSQIALAVVRKILSSLTPSAHAAMSGKITESAEAYDLYLKGLAELRKPRQPGNLDKAASGFTLALNIDHRFARAHAGMCEVELARFRLNRDVVHFENAERSCNRALTLDAGLLEVHVALGNLYRSSGQYDKAQISFEHALVMNPYFEEANYGLARSYQGQGDLAEAERLLRFSIELEPGYSATYQAMGHFLNQNGRFEEAVPYLAKVTALAPDNPDGFTSLGAVNMNSGHWNSAAEAFSRSLELAPTSMGYGNLGTLYYYQGRYREAADLYKKAIEKSPANHWLWGKMAATQRYIDGQNSDSQFAYQEAIRLATEHLQVDPADSETMAYLAAYFVNIGATDTATEYRGKAIELAPESPEAWYFSGLIQERIGDREQALADLKRAVALGYPSRLMAADPQFSDLKDMDEFKALLQ